MSDDVARIGALLDAMYAMVSGPAGPRDWSRQDEVFHPDCRQIRTGRDENGRPWMKSFTLAQYRADADALLSTRGFYEIEIAREIRIFGNMAHVWSAYEAKTDPGDAAPERRGINSIQFYNDGDAGWRIISMIWDNERPGLTLDDGFPDGMPV